jgi:hypothetical protein
MRIKCSHLFALSASPSIRANTPCAPRRERQGARLTCIPISGGVLLADERTAGGKNFADLGSVDSTRISGTLLSPRLNHYGSVEGR